MKPNESIKKVLVRRLSESFTSQVSLFDFNDVFLYLDRCNVLLKIVPYGIFENPDNMVNLKKTIAGRCFWLWLDKNTAKIERDFNKSRKLVREFKVILEFYRDILPYNLSVWDIFRVALTSLFIHYGENTKFGFEAPNEKFHFSLNVLREYLSCIFLLDLLLPDYLDKVLEVFIFSDLHNLFGDLFGLVLSIEKV